MKLDELQQKLLSSARANPPDERVPYAFEQRVMARLALAVRPDQWAAYARGLWHAAAACVGLMLLLGALSFFARPHSSTVGDLSQEFENTLLAGVDQDQPADSTR